jgi:hypothetical protein
VRPRLRVRWARRGRDGLDQTHSFGARRAVVVGPVPQRALAARSIVDGTRRSRLAPRPL